MATTKKVGSTREKLVILDPATGELKDLPEDVLKNRQDLNGQLMEEAERKAHWMQRATDWTMVGLANNLRMVVVSLGCIAIGAVLGIFGQPHFEQHTQAAQLYKAMQTSVPVLNALEVSGDPGKYAGKLVDVVMTPTQGGVFKSGKGLFIAEHREGLSLVIFESAFSFFQEAYGVEKPENIPAALIGKTIKARGMVQNRPMPNGQSRTSMIVSAPGLIQILPEK